MKGIEELLSHRGEIDAELRKNKSPVTVMFTDLAGSTAFFERFGDTVGMAWIEAHYKIIFPFVEQNNGVVVKTIGDSVMAYFTDPVQAVTTATAIQNSMAKWNADRDAKEQMHVRVALHHGLAYVRGVDVFGDVVNVAARIAKACLPAQILISEAVYVNAQQNASVQFRHMGSVHFHGKTGLEKLYEVLWTDEAAYEKVREQFPARPQQKQSSADDFSGGRYIIMNELGRGAMGVVYKAYDRMIGRMVALKTIPLEVDPNEKPELLARLKQEARAAGILDHPNIVTVYDVGEEAGMFYFTMQYVQGKSLASVRSEKKLLPVEEVLSLMEQVCSAIGFAHQQSIIHRDIKPSNLMVTEKGVLKVMDFGIAKLGDAGVTKAGVIVGTPSYLAPEQAAGRRIDRRSDIFAIGSVLYELLTAEKAFPGESTTSIIFKILNEDPIPPRAIEPSLPAALDAIVQKALAKDPGQRFQTCEEMLTAIQECRQNPATVTVSVPMPTRRMSGATAEVAPQQPRRHWTAIIVVAACLVLAGAGGLVWRSKLSPRASAQPAPASQPAVPPPVEAGTAKPEPSSSGGAASQADATSPGTPDTKPALSEPAAAVTVSTAKLETRSKTKSKSETKVEKKSAKAKVETEKPADAPPPAPALSAADETEVERYVTKGDEYLGQGKYDLAIASYNRALKIDSKNRRAQDGVRRAKELKEGAG